MGSLVWRCGRVGCCVSFLLWELGDFIDGNMKVRIARISGMVCACFWENWGGFIGRVLCSIVR